jgi:hypothetical protein
LQVEASASLIEGREPPVRVGPSWGAGVRRTPGKGGADAIVLRSRAKPGGDADRPAPIDRF